MSVTRDQMQLHFREQLAICDAYGSPFTARLIEHMSADFEAGGPTVDLAGSWTGRPGADMVALRLCGALHAAALMGRAPELAAHYPEQRAAWDMAALWPLAQAFLARERQWVVEFIRSPPQTNEVRRSIALLAGFLTFANTYDGPIDTLELGASAGLNLNLDRFHYRTASWSWGPSAEHGEVAVDTDWQGAPPPLDARFQIRSRAGCDLNPLNIADPAQRLQLRSYIWADQHDRLARFDAAAAVAVARGVQVERADAEEWLARRLAARAPDAATIVYHSVFLQYPPPATRAAIVATIEAAGAQATARAPLAWLRLEPESLFGGPRGSLRFVLELVTWPGGDHRLLAITDGHVRSVQSVPA